MDQTRTSQAAHRRAVLRAARLRRQRRTQRVVTAVLLLVGMLIPSIKAVSALQTHPRPTVAYVVQPGDTLWEIAGRVDPDRDPRAVIHDLLELNQRRSAALLPGERLLLPAP